MVFSELDSELEMIRVHPHSRDLYWNSVIVVANAFCEVSETGMWGEQKKPPK